MEEYEQDFGKVELGNTNHFVDRSTAEYLLKDTKLSSVDAARLIMELLESSPNMKYGSAEEVICYCRRVIHMGLEAYELSKHTVTFREAVTAVEFYKNSVRERTMNEIRQICKRIMKDAPEWVNSTMREIDTDMCQQTIEKIFKTVPMQRKAKRILHSVFAHARLNGWCSGNPLDLVVLPPYVEKPIRALSIDEVIALLETSQLPRHKPCAIALGLMLWAGVRPNEVLRLHHSDINFEDKVITIPAKHSKTGGSRQVTMYPPLFHWLRKNMPYYIPNASVVPTSWLMRWAELRHNAGFAEWVPDILRHTFASYHLKHFRDINALLMDMGHATAQQLRTRYLAMDNVTKKTAKIFWEYGIPSSSK